MASESGKEAIESHTAASNTTPTNPPMMNAGQDRDDQAHHSISVINTSDAPQNNIGSNSPDRETAPRTARDSIPLHEPIPDPGLTAAATTNLPAYEQEDFPDLHESAQLSNLRVDNEWDSDSAIGTERGSSTDSIRSSIYAFVEENGRRYHKYKEGKYYFPNDEMEQDRLDLQHNIYLLMLDGRLHLAPLEDLKGGLHNVLDIATGTGIWAIDFASAYPSANVIGTDLSPIQPQFTPPNCHFEVDDAEDEWLYSYKFDYIHGRMLGSCFTSHLTVFRSAYAAMRPGGWMEMQDFGFPFQCIDDSISGTAFERWLNATLAGISALGKDFGQAKLYAQYMREVGFVDVTEKQFAWPIGSWSKGQKMKLLGAWAKQDALAGLQGWSMAILTRGLRMTLEEVEGLLAEVKKDINGRKLHVYAPIYIVYGRKPEV